jgi:hypothetical protein
LKSGSAQIGVAVADFFRRSVSPALPVRNTDVSMCSTGKVRFGPSAPASPFNFQWRPVASQPRRPRAAMRACGQLSRFGVVCFSRSGGFADRSHMR